MLLFFRLISDKELHSARINVTWGLEEDASGLAVGSMRITGGIDKGDAIVADHGHDESGRRFWIIRSFLGNFVV